MAVEGARCRLDGGCGGAVRVRGADLMEGVEGVEGAQCKLDADENTSGNIIGHNVDEQG